MQKNNRLWRNFGDLRRTFGRRTSGDLWGNPSEDLRRPPAPHLQGPPGKLEEPRATSGAPPGTFGENNPAPPGTSGDLLGETSASGAPPGTSRDFRGTPSASWGFWGRRTEISAWLLFAKIEFAANSHTFRALLAIIVFLYANFDFWLFWRGPDPV